MIIKNQVQSLSNEDVDVPKALCYSILKKGLFYSILKKALCYSILTKQNPQYLFNLVPVRHYISKEVSNCPFFNTTVLKTFFHRLSSNGINQILTFAIPGVLFIFKRHILHFIRPSSNFVYNCHNPKGLKLCDQTSFGLDSFKRA